MRKAVDENKNKPKKATPQTKEERLAEALRANLRRRKAGKTKLTG
ncbi:MAG: hypothetical protein Q9M33_08850 [Robiginitomaculum sp.]|nr:hypothetical protein [Robiginitomaculum sp.]MDQ7077838.1 hypothetical protein [Robiginitomaculum sp.]